MCFSQVLGYTFGLFEAAGFLFWGCGCRSKDQGFAVQGVHDAITLFILL